jgi:hypothetical protein
LSVSGQSKGVEGRARASRGGWTRVSAESNESTQTSSRSRRGAVVCAGCSGADSVHDDDMRACRWSGRARDRVGGMSAAGETVATDASSSEVADIGAQQQQR